MGNQTYPETCNGNPKREGKNKMSEKLFGGMIMRLTQFDEKRLFIDLRNSILSSINTKKATF